MSNKPLVKYVQNQKYSLLTQWPDPNKTSPHQY